MKEKKPHETLLFMVTVRFKWLATGQIGGTLGHDFMPLISRTAISRLKNISNVYSTVVTLGRFRNDTTAAEDLQQVVFKFPEFNKLLLRGCLFSYENSDIGSDSRGRFSLSIIMFVWSNV